MKRIGRGWRLNAWEILAIETGIEYLRDTGKADHASATALLQLIREAKRITISTAPGGPRQPN